MAVRVTDADLLKEAQAALEAAYAPYSNFKVGSALLTAEGKVFRGANIENVSYGATVCAERVALFKALSEGERNFTRLALVGAKRRESGSSKNFDSGPDREARGPQKTGMYMDIHEDFLGPQRSEQAASGVFRGVRLLPCGICRQVLSEFAEDLTIILQAGGKIVRKKLSKLYPEPFIREA